MIEPMVEHNVVPGTDEWLALRTSFFTASEAPAMMGESPFMTRDELLKLKVTGTSEPVTPHMQSIFNKGHAAEAAARPYAAKIAGEDLFTKTGSRTIEGMPLLASFDGLTMEDDVAFEHKLYKEEIVNALLGDTLALHYVIQMEQQMLVSGADKVLFMTSDGTPNKMEFSWYRSNKIIRAKIIAGWKQFAIDLDAYEHVEEVVPPKAEPVPDIKSLQIEVVGSVTSSNLSVYQKDAFELITRINTNLVTDEDFVQAAENIKALQKVEAHIKHVKQTTIDQTVDISVLFRDMDLLSSKVRDVRLKLEKLEKTEKNNRKFAILHQAKKDYVDHRVKVSKDIMAGRDYLPEIETKFVEVIKGKKTLKSLQNACSTELARLKIEVDSQARKIGVNLTAIKKKASEHKFLFADIKDIITKDADDFILLVDSRISQHDKLEEEKLEASRELIRDEERQKLELEQEAPPEEKSPICDTTEPEREWGRWDTRNTDRDATAPPETEPPHEDTSEKVRSEDFYAPSEEEKSAARDTAICALREVAAPMSEKKGALIIDAIIKGEVEGIYSKIK